MELNELKKQLKSGSILPVYLFWGQEEYLKRYYFDELKKKLLSGAPEEFNYHVFDENSFSADYVMNAADAYPMGAEKKLILLRDLDYNKLKGAAKELMDGLLSAVPEHVCLVFYFDFAHLDDQKKQKELFTLVEKSGGVMNFQLAPPRQLVPWIVKHAEAKGKRIDPAVAEYLIEFTDGTMTSISSELEKLCAFTDEETIEKRHIDAIVTPVTDSSVFDLTNAVVRRDYDTVLRLIGELRDAKEEPVALLSGISVAFTEFLYVKLAQNQGITSSAQLLKDLKIPPRREFLIKKYFRMAADAPLPLLRYCVSECMEADELIKRSRVDKWTILELLVCRLLAYESRKN